MSQASAAADAIPVLQAYDGACAFHGDLGVSYECFCTRVLAIVHKYLGTNAPEARVQEFVAALHTTDLYLALACAQSAARAWDRFMAIYEGFINDLAAFSSPNRDAGRELASSVRAEMFLPDRSGRSRIASYDGRCSLATWLRVVITNRAINERERKANQHERIDDLVETADQRSILTIEASLRAGRYEAAIHDSFKHACVELSDRERLLLLLRYDQGYN